MLFSTEDKKAIKTICFFFCFYLLFGLIVFQVTGKISNSSDFVFHLQKASGQPVHDYAPGYYWFFSVFSLNQIVFWLINLIMVFFLIPFFVFKIAKTVWSIPIYFCGVSFAWETMFSATFPSAFVALLFIVYLLLREKGFLFKFFSFVLLSVLASISHSFGFVLFCAIGVAELLVFFKNNKCFFLGATLSVPARVFSFNFETFFYSVFFFLPLPTMFFGLKKIDFFSGLLCLASFIGAFTNYRALMIAQLLFCVFSAKGIVEHPEKVKLGFALFLGINFLLYFFSFGWGVVQLIQDF